MAPRPAGSPLGARDGDGRLLPNYLKAQIGRELDRLELDTSRADQGRGGRAEESVGFDRSEQICSTGDVVQSKDRARSRHPLVRGTVLPLRSTTAKVAAYAGLAPTPWQSGSVDREQGISKAGNPRLRETMIQLAWLWRRHQPRSVLTLWFEERVRHNAGRLKKRTIVALARATGRALEVCERLGCQSRGCDQNCLIHHSCRIFQSSRT